MKTRFLVAIAAGSAFALLADRAPAHGGMYRGPRDTVPPAPGPGGGGPAPAGRGGPTTGTPGAPSAPAPSGPASPGPTTGGGPGPGPGGAPRGGPTTGGIDLEPDLGTWDYWWEFNKDGYLGLKDAVHDAGAVTGEDGFFLGGTRRRTATLKPSNGELRDELLPALRRAIDATADRDIASSCLVAMAKIGIDHPEFTLVDVFRPRLQRGDQEIRETAALAIGIAARTGHGELELLSGLALDDKVGRAAYGGEVDTRTRAFALHGLGLLAHEHSDLAVKRAAFATLRTVLDGDRIANRNLGVAAIHAIGILDVGTATAGDQQLQREAVDCLARFFALQLGAGEQLIQAHCPTAIAKLVGRSGDAAAAWKQRFADELKSPKGRRGHDVARSCALALGQLCGRHDDAGSADAAFSQLLWDTWVGHPDDQTRRFALVALGQIGGTANRTALLKALPNARRTTEKPWVALALGVLAFAQRQADGLDRRSAAADHELGAALHRELAAAKEPGLVGALAVALGLAHHRPAGPDMLERMSGDLQKQDQAGYLALGLALMDERTAVEPLHAVVSASTRRPELLKQAAVALGLLGDKAASRVLVARLAAEQTNVATFAALSGALGLIGDRDSLPPLQQLLADPSRSDLTRAFAAVALGGVADRARLPWYAKIAANLNYRATVETLSNRQSGILDIL
jgi:hypothetical protein